MKNELLNVAIIGGDYQSIDILSKAIYDIICPKDILLFNVLYSTESSLGYIWAKENGMPTKKIGASNQEKLKKRLLYFEADYIFFVLHDEQWIKNMIMEYRMTGKHGTVIKTPYAAVQSFTLPLSRTAAFLDLGKLPHWTPPTDYDEEYYKEIWA